MIRFSRVELAAIAPAQTSTEAVGLYREALGEGLRTDGAIRDKWRRMVAKRRLLQTEAV